MDFKDALDLIDFHANSDDYEIKNAATDEIVDELKLLVKLQESHELPNIQYANIEYGRGGNSISLYIGDHHRLVVGRMIDLECMVDIGIGVNKCITRYIGGHGSNPEYMYRQFYDIVIMLDCDLPAIEHVMDDIMCFGVRMVMGSGFEGDVIHELFAESKELFENGDLFPSTKIKRKKKNHCKFDARGKQVKRKEPYQRRNY